MKDGKPVILYVEDDADFRDSMRIILEANGYTMIEAESGEEGVARFKKEHPDLIIVDLMMEEVDTGTSMIRDLKMAGCDVPIVMATSAADALVASTSAEQLGLAGVLQKPIDPPKLLNLIATKLAASP